MALILTRENIEKYNIDNSIAGIVKVYNNHGIDAIWSKSEKDQKEEIINGTKYMFNADEIKSKLIKNKNYKLNHIVVAQEPYKNSGAEARNLQKINDKIRLIKKKFRSPSELKQNISHMPEDAADLFDIIRIDITRRTLARADIVPFICQIVRNDRFQNPQDVKWLFEYAAPFKKFEGKGDKVNLVQIKTGDKEAVYFTFWGVGFEQDLYNMLFNEIFDMGRVNDAVARGYIARKNDTIISQILDFVYPTEKIVPADTSGDSLDDKYYNTFSNAIDIIGSLKDPQTNREIDISGLSVLCHSTRVRQINRAINGRLVNGDTIKNLDALGEISRLIPYNGDTIIYGNEQLDYRGIPKDKAYMYIPGANFWYLEKRGLTRETGPGDVFSFSSDKDAWYFVDSSYATQFFGGADGATTEEKEQGYIVEVNLPT